MPDLSNIPDHELVAELESRGLFSRLVRFLTSIPKGESRAFKVETVPLDSRPAVPPAPAKFFPNSDRKLPVGTTEVKPVPGRSNPNGTPLHVATIGKGLQDRLTATDKNLDGVAQDGTSGKFIVKGDDRRALAQSFIDSWQNEIRQLEMRLESEVLSQDQIEDIHREIDLLRRQIDMRRDSAFGDMSFEEVMARNEADNGPGAVDHVESLPGTPGVGIKWDFPTGIDAIDNPKRLHWDIQERPEVLVRLKAIIPQDPCLGHLDKPVIFGESGTTTSMQVLADPVVFMRLMVALDRVYKELRVDLVKSRLLLTIWDLGQNALNEAKDNPPGPALRGRYAADFCAAWTDYLKFRLNQAVGAGQDDHTYRSIKRQIRIWNPDFQEMEVPDFMFEESLPIGFVQGAVDEGSQKVTEARPYINPNTAWKETPAGPGVFKMSPPKGRTFGRKPE